ncbi:Dolichyl-diphosphooligosaccharide--protein glycosyltransferase subunit 2 [Abeliophyllum distichum]|uniref:Ribophorin II n=1 Tax=Abeliophyllum distichum TaxID=126358 RepID=A0ABD1VPK7_9LAMI
MPKSQQQKPFKVSAISPRRHGAAKRYTGGGRAGVRHRQPPPLSSNSRTAAEWQRTRRTAANLASVQLLSSAALRCRVADQRTSAAPGLKLRQRQLPKRRCRSPSSPRDFLGLVEKFFCLSGRYDIQLTVGDTVMENSFLQLLGYLELDLPDAPEKAARPPQQPVHPYSRYGPKAEIIHIFRAPEKQPPRDLSFVFLGLVLLPFFGFVAGLFYLRANSKNLPKSTVPATFAMLFHLGIAAVLLLYTFFWLKSFMCPSGINDFSITNSSHIKVGILRNAFTSAVQMIAK